MKDAEIYEKNIKHDNNDIEVNIEYSETSEEHI